MKIRGSSPFSNVQQTRRSAKSQGAKKSSPLSKSEASSAVAAAESIAPIQPPDSPIYDAMASASRGFSNGDSLEEATHAVVSAVIHEHFGKKGIPQQEVSDITQAVSLSINDDAELRQRLESVLRRISPPPKQ